MLVARVLCACMYIYIHIYLHLFICVCVFAVKYACVSKRAVCELCMLRTALRTTFLVYCGSCFMFVYIRALVWIIRVCAIAN